MPTSADVATWISTSLGAGLTLPGAQSWGGICVTGALTDIGITGMGTLTNGASGIDLSISPVNLMMGNPIALGANQTWNVTNSRTLTMGGIISGSGFSLTKAGLGTLTLACTNSYGGNTVIAAGTLQLEVPTASDGAAIWLDATRGVTTNGSGKVTIWADQSGNGRNATNNWNSGPTVTADINGLPTLRFTLSNSQYLGAGGLGSVSNLTAFVVHKDTPTNEYEAIIATDGAWGINGTYGNSVHFNINAGGAVYTLAYVVNGGVNIAGMQNTAVGVVRLDEFVDSGRLCQLFLNGAANGTATSPTLKKNMSAFKIGSWDATRYLDSSIGEILLYTKVLSAAERQATYAYLNGKWFNPARYGILRSASSNLLAASSSVNIDAGTVLDLGGKSQKIASLSGSGIVTNGALAVTEHLYPAGTNTAGTLTLKADASLSGTLHVDIEATGACDRLTVTGALNLANASLAITNPLTLDKRQKYTVIASSGGLSGSFANVSGLPPAWFVRYDRVAGLASLVYRDGTLIRIFLPDSKDNNS